MTTKTSAAASPVTGDFQIFLPLAKVEKNADGTCTVSGYASTSALDLDGEIVALDAVKKALPGYWAWRNVREMHTNSAVGVAKEANIDEKGLFLTSKIVDREAARKCIEGVYQGYSIGGKKLAKSGNTITEIELIEVSIVDRPANPECRIEVAKRAKDSTAPAHLIKLASSFRSNEAKAVAQMAKAVKTLSKAAISDEPLAKIEVAPPALCKKHGLAECAKCAMKAAAKMKKRDVSTSERHTLASEGKALPDGSFPIANASDLANARQAIGRAKNPSAARAHIKRRAAALGVKLPSTWSKKLAKRLITEAVDLPTLAKSPHPSFLTLGADDKSRSSPPELVEGDVLSGHEHGIEQFQLQKGGTSTAGASVIGKRMGSAGSLAYCFDSIRDTQRNLLRESQREGGDKKDAALAMELGSIAQKLAAVIGQKAEHEGAEALDLSDADDVDFNLEDFAMAANNTTNGGDSLEKFLEKFAKRGQVVSKAARVEMARANLKKAKGARQEAESAIKAAHAMHKAAYLSKAAGKKSKNDDDGDEFDHADAMSKLQKAYGELEKLGTFVKAANVQLKKAAARSGQRGQEAGDAEGGFYEVPAGVKDLSPSALASASPGGDGSGSTPPILGMDMNSPYPGKSARVAKGFVSPEVAQLMAEKAAAEAKVELLEKMPVQATGGRRPASWDVGKLMAGNVDVAPLMKGVDVSKIDFRDESAHTREVGKMIGNMIAGGHGARNVMTDPTFHGTVGG